MKLHILEGRPREVAHNPDTKRLDPRSPRRLLITLGDDHVPAIAPAPFEVAPTRRTLGNRRDHFDQRIAERQQDVLEPVLRQPRVAVRDFDPEDRGEVVPNGLDGVTDERDLAKTKPHAGSPGSWC
ncbi:MAG: hypothetical protein ACSLFM_08650 [Tepidiformaceae bacterium]